MTRETGPGRCEFTTAGHRCTRDAGHIGSHFAELSEPVTEWTVPDEAVAAAQRATKHTLARGLARPMLEAAAPFIRADLEAERDMWQNEATQGYEIVGELKSEVERLRRKLRAEVGEPAPSPEVW